MMKSIKKNEIEIPKFKKIFSNNEIDEEKEPDYLKRKYLNSESNFNLKNNFTNKNSNKKIINNSATDRKINRILNSDNKESNNIDGEEAISPIQHMKKVPSISYLSKKNPILEYSRRHINPFKKLEPKK